MHAFQLLDEQEFNPKRHVEKVLGRIATEIYFCFQGCGTMRTPTETVEVKPGAFVVHPPDELHEYENGAERTLLFRVRYGADMAGRTIDWRGNPDWKPQPA